MRKNLYNGPLIISNEDEVPPYSEAGICNIFESLAMVNWLDYTPFSEQYHKQHAQTKEDRIINITRFLVNNTTVHYMNVWMPRSNPKYKHNKSFCWLTGPKKDILRLEKLINEAIKHGFNNPQCDLDPYRNMKPPQ